MAKIMSNEELKSVTGGFTIEMNMGQYVVLATLEELEIIQKKNLLPNAAIGQMRLIKGKKFYPIGSFASKDAATQHIMDLANRMS